MCKWRNNEARSRNHCCRGNAVSVCTCSGLCLRACSLTNPACNAPPYCHLRPLWLHQLFRHYLINGMIFGEKLLQCAVWFFSTTFIWNIFHFKKNWVRYCHKCDDVFMYSARYSCRILMKLEFSRHISEKKSSNINFHQNASSGSRVILSGQTDRLARRS